MIDRLYSKKEARELLRVSGPTLDRMIERGRLPVIRMSARTIRVSHGAILDLIERATERRAQKPAYPQE
jgi:excisionase family DNA binding protein